MIRRGKEGHATECVAGTGPWRHAGPGFVTPVNSAVLLCMRGKLSAERALV